MENFIRIIGDYNPTTTYSYYDAVYYNYGLWVSISETDITGVNPENSPHWVRYTQGLPGPAGATGATGPAGPQGQQGPKGDAGTNSTFILITEPEYYQLPLAQRMDPSIAYFIQ